MENNLNELYKEKILGVLEYCISFFEKHGIRWFIACGSAIGAVRHRGIIPWDDDIDIYMPRADYNKLISIREEMVGDGFRFVCLQDEGYPYAFGKVMDDRTTVWQYRRFPFNVGCYVDIFPLDLTDSGMMSFSKKWKRFRDAFLRYRAKISSVTFRGIASDIRSRHSDTLRVIPVKLLLMFRKRERMLKELLEMEKGWNKPDGDRYVSYTEAGMYMFPREWFEDYIIVPFEHLQVRIPKHYDEYLTYIYGDYMTPPPEESRSGDGPHGKLYINLERNVPLSKVKV